ncbi:alkylmercury lyase, partial [Vibrio sp. 1974]|nr:alkylmercury lyase [Vibrio sp. 1974]
MKLAPYILERLTSVNRTNGTADLLVPLLRELA